MEEEWKGRERREAVRMEQIIPAEYNLINDVKSVELNRKRKCVVRNISARGVCLELDEEIDESLVEGLYNGLIKLGLEMRLPNQEAPIRALAKVAWLTKGWSESEAKSKCVLGLEFLDITTPDQDAIRDYVINSYLGGRD